MRRYLVRRLLLSFFTFFLFITLIFFLLEALPGDYLTAVFGESRLTAEQTAAIRIQLGLQKSPLEQYLQWMGDFLRGDLGVSTSQNPRPVIQILAERVPRTLVLFLTATVISFTLGFLAGKALAWRREGVLETLAAAGGTALYTVFTPWFALWMLWLFAYELDWFPHGQFLTDKIWNGPAPDSSTVFLEILLSGIVLTFLTLGVYLLSRSSPPAKKRILRSAGFAAAILPVAGWWIVSGQAVYGLDILYHMALPVGTLSLISFGGIMLLTRGSMQSALQEEYLLTARAKGLPDSVIRDRHAARSALLPVVTALVFSLAFAIDGSVIIESVFSWEGMGYTLMQAVTLSDIPLAVGALALTAALVLAAHCAADILYALLDPRIRISRYGADRLPARMPAEETAPRGKEDPA